MGWAMTATAIDTNVVLSWMVKGAPHHAETGVFLRRELESGRRIALLPLVLHEYVHVVTDGRRLARPLSMEAALGDAEALWNSFDVLRVLPGEGTVTRTLELMRRWGLGRKRILDTALAATLEEAGVRRLATFNVGDFAVFSFLEVVSPARMPTA